MCGSGTGCVHVGQTCWVTVCIGKTGRGAFYILLLYKCHWHRPQGSKRWGFVRKKERMISTACGSKWLNYFLTKTIENSNTCVLAAYQKDSRCEDCSRWKFNHKEITSLVINMFLTWLWKFNHKIQYVVCIIHINVNLNVYQTCGGQFKSVLNLNLTNLKTCVLLPLLISLLLSLQLNR